MYTLYRLYLSIESIFIGARQTIHLSTIFMTRGENKCVCP